MLHRHFLCCDTNNEQDVCLSTFKYKTFQYLFIVCFLEENINIKLQVIQVSLFQTSMSKISTEKPNCSTQRKKQITTLNSLLEEFQENANMFMYTKLKENK